MVKFSIITPVLNGENTIARTVESVLNQPQSIIEQYIVIDGGSIDSTLQILDGFDDPRLEIHSSRDEGIYDGMNRGISRCECEIVGIINADDYYKKDVFCLISEYLKEHPSVDILHGNLLLLKNDVEKLKIPHLGLKGKLGLALPFWHPTMFVKKAVYDKIGVYDIKYPIAADQDFYFRAMESDIEIAFLSEVFSVMQSGGVSGEKYNSAFELLDIHRNRRSCLGKIAHILYYYNSRIRYHPDTPKGRIDYLKWALNDFKCH